MTHDKDVKDAIRSTGCVTNGQAWDCSDAVMKLPVWDRVIALEEALTEAQKWLESNAGISMLKGMGNPDVVSLLEKINKALKP